MITALFFKNGSEKLVGFRIDGHAGAADYGYDVVCAGVSSAIEFSANLLTDFLKLDAKAEVNGNAVMLKILNDKNDIGDKVLLGLVNHIDFISAQNPGRIKIEINKIK